MLRAAWDQVGVLRAHRIAHRDLRLANVFLGDDGNVWLIDFGFSEVAASDLLIATDVAELVASSSVVVGAERATALARETVDEATLAAACARLRPRVLERRDASCARAAAGSARGPPRPAGPAMSWSGLVVAAVGLVVLVASVVAARHPFIPALGAARLPGGQRPARVAVPACCGRRCSSGNLVVGTAVGFAIAAWAGELDVAVGVVVAAVLKLVAERIVRREMAAYLEVRQRPGTSEPGAVLRGDVPAIGPSFPSGHVILVAAVASLAAPARVVGVGMGAVHGGGRRDGRAGVRRRAQPARHHRRPRRRAARRRPAVGDRLLTALSR